MTVLVSRCDPRDPEARSLLAESHALMRRLFPPEENHAIPADALTAPGIVFVGARLDGTLVGCAALANKPGYGEIKSMFVSPGARGRGVAAALLDRIEDEARALGLTVLRLETGDVLVAARRAYSRHGFVERGPFGDYPDTASSVFMEKRLGG